MNLIVRSKVQYMSTTIQRDPDRWLYKKAITFVKCFIENRQNSYGNYFASLKCKSDYLPEGPCHLNKIEKFGVEQIFKLCQQINKLTTHQSVRHHGAFIQSIIDESRKAKKERKEYTKYIQSLDNGRELKQFDQEPSIKKLDQMRKDYQAVLLRKHEDELKRKKLDHEAKKVVRKLKQQQMQKQLREKIEADKRTLEAFQSASKSGSEQTRDKSDKNDKSPSRKPKK